MTVVLARQASTLSYHHRPAQLFFPFSSPFPLILYLWLVCFSPSPYEEVSSLQKFLPQAPRCWGQTEAAILGSGSPWIYLFIYLSMWLVSLVFCNGFSSIPGCPLICYIVEIGFDLLILPRHLPSTPLCLTYIWTSKRLSYSEFHIFLLPPHLSPIQSPSSACRPV